MFSAKFEKVRFNIEFGPPSLFERVLFKMRDVTELNMDGSHFNERLHERKIPVEIIERIRHFDIKQWNLQTVEVRKDRGKFINSTWEINENGIRYWVSIGLGNYITTVIRKESKGADKCIKCGDYYNFVEKVNRELMDAEVYENINSI